MKKSTTITNPDLDIHLPSCTLPLRLFILFLVCNLYFFLHFLTIMLCYFSPQNIRFRLRWKPVHWQQLYIFYMFIIFNVKQIVIWSAEYNNDGRCYPEMMFPIVCFQGADSILWRCRWLWVAEGSTCSRKTSRMLSTPALGSTTAHEKTGETLYRNGLKEQRTKYVFPPLPSLWCFSAPFYLPSYIFILRNSKWLWRYHSDFLFLFPLFIYIFLMCRKAIMSGTSSSSYHWTLTMWITYWVSLQPPL